jgi:hypothetical protein
MGASGRGLGGLTAVGRRVAAHAMERGIRGCRGPGPPRRFVRLGPLRYGLIELEGTARSVVQDGLGP